MDGDRVRRQATVDGRGGKKFKNALAELAELRKTGAKRANIYEVQEEEAVYDEVDEEQYARIVQKRREEGGERKTILGEEVSNHCILSHRSLQLLPFNNYLPYSSQADLSLVRILWDTRT